MRHIFIYCLLLLIVAVGICIVVHIGKKSTPISPFTDCEKVARHFAGGVWGKSMHMVKAMSKPSNISFRRIAYPDTSANFFRLHYLDDYRHEEVILDSDDLRKFSFFYRRSDFFEILFRINLGKEDRPIDFWCESYDMFNKTGIIEEKDSVCYLFKSGIVLQVAKLGNDMDKLDSFKVVRIRFVGESFRSRFLQANILTQDEVEYLKKNSGCVKRP